MTALSAWLIDIGCCRPLSWRAHTWLGSALLCACTSASAPLPREGKPAGLGFSISGFGVGSAVLQLRGDTVVLRKMSWNSSAVAATDTVRAIPSPEAWRAFWTAADAAGVNRWHERYVAARVADGVSWELRLGTGGRELTSAGMNAYPDRDGNQHDVDATVEFRAFVTALNGLVGRIVFY